MYPANVHSLALGGRVLAMAMRTKTTMTTMEKAIPGATIMGFHEAMGFLPFIFLSF